MYILFLLIILAGPHRSDQTDSVRHLPPPPPHGTSTQSAADSKAVTFMTGGETMKVCATAELCN